MLKKCLPAKDLAFAFCQSQKFKLGHLYSKVWLVCSNELVYKQISYSSCPFFFTVWESHARLPILLLHLIQHTWVQGAFGVVGEKTKEFSAFFVLFLTILCKAPFCWVRRELGGIVGVRTKEFFTFRRILSTCSNCSKFRNDLWAGLNSWKTWFYFNQPCLIQNPDSKVQSN